MNKNSCELCELVVNLEPVFETKYWKVILNHDQGYLGRCFVTLKKHKGALSELNDEEWLDYAAVVQKLEAALEVAFGAKLFNWTCLMNNAFKEESPMPHIHWHVRPRYSNTVSFGGVEYIDPEFGSHYNREQRFFSEANVLNEINSTIKQHLK